MQRLIRIVIIAAMFTALAVVIYSPAAADSSVTIDFEGLAEDTVVSSVSSGSGVSGDAVPGSIAVLGTNPALGAVNAAVIFDAECGGAAANCSGGDEDLFDPGHGNALIVDEDLVGEADDADVENAHIDFDFSGFGTEGNVTVESIRITDIGDDGPGGGEVQLYADAAMTILITTVALPDLGNGAHADVTIGVAGVVAMRVVLSDSGSIDEIELTVPEEPTPTPTNTPTNTPTPTFTPTPTNTPTPGTEGCTPGYWKQTQHFDSWTGFTTDQTLESVFDVPDAYGLDNDSLLTALNYSGGSSTTGAAQILLRAAVASLLNSSNPDVDFTLTTAQVIADVNAALASNDRATILGLAAELDADNNLGCDLD